MQDLQKKPKYLVTFTVGLDQRNNIDAAVKKVLTWVIHLSITNIMSLLFSDFTGQGY